MTKNMKDSLLDLERHRQLLESNTERLRKSLQHWQTWEAEYEGLKEEIQALGPDTSHGQLVAIAIQYDGKLVTRKEAEDIVGVQAPRNKGQVTSVLDRRIDYVSRNVKTLEKQLEVAENKLAAATVISNPDVRNDEGLPLTEIIEELDEDGHMISGRTETQGSARGQLLEVLEKAGVKDLPNPKNKELLDSSSAENEPRHDIVEVGEEAEERANEKPTLPALVPVKKSVQFVANTKLGPEILKSQTANRIEAISNLSKQHIITADDSPFIPTNESPEDAKLRKEMLEYGMSEVGAVVAELDLEDGSDISDEDFDYSETSSIEEEEDEHGRSTKKVVDEEIRRQMLEIENRLGLRMMENVGPGYEVKVDEQASKDVNFPQEKVELPLRLTESRLAKKGVRFAPELDISPVTQAVQPVTLAPNAKILSKSPIGDIVERAPPKSEAVATAPTPRKVSSFKSARLAQPSSEPSTEGKSPLPSNANVSSLGGKTFADHVIEREILKNSIPSEPDEFDPALLQQGVTNEYYRSRNRMIQKQGGFMKGNPEEESGIIPLTEEEGGPKKVSRFKAARLAR